MHEYENLLLEIICKYLITMIKIVIINIITRKIATFIPGLLRINDPFNGKGDFINQLPDHILVLIIARIPTRTAVSTSILSKRWRNLYKSLSSFELSCTDLWSQYTHPPHYSGFVFTRLERFLGHYSDSKIHDLKLSCCLSRCDQKFFELCIYRLRNSSLEELHLSLSCDYVIGRSFVSISCDLLCELSSLKHLKLRACSLQTSLKSKWNSLRTLNLSETELVYDSLDCILSKCLNLHSLFLISCRCPFKLRFSGPNLRLKTLVIEDCEGGEIIQLQARNLSRFELRSKHMVIFVFGSLPQLETIYVFIKHQTPHSERINMMPLVFGELPKYAPAIKFLTFETKADLFQENIRATPMGMRFGNLRRLDIVLSCTPRTNLLALIPYLWSCPLLEELQLNLSEMHEKVGVGVKPVIVHYTQLKKVGMSGFTGTDNEIAFALYILKTAVALDQLCITRCLRYCSGSGKEKLINTTPWSKDTLSKIQLSLQGQPLWGTARLIIQHKS